MVSPQHVGELPEELQAIGSLAISTWEKEYLQNEVDCHYELLMSLTTLEGEDDIMKALVDSGVDFLLADDQGNNIIHGLVDLAQNHQETAVEVLHAILKLVKDQETTVRLILKVNDQGQTPLDMAAEKCIPEMMHALINTDGVYRFMIQNAGTHTHFLFDVTSFEMHKAHQGTGLLHYLSVVTEKQLERIDQYKFLDKEPFATWLKILGSSNAGHTRFWMCMWFVYVLLYLALIIIHGKYKQIPGNVISITLLCISAIFALLEVKGLYLCFPYFKMVLKKFKQGLVPITFVCAYRIFQTFFIITVTISQFIQLCILDCMTKTGVILYLETLNVFFGFMSLMFFTQLSTSMGYYLTIIEKMITNTIAFLLLSFFIFTAFVVTFHITYIPPYCSGNDILNDTNTSTDIYGSFSTLYHSFYETFLLGLAVTAPKDWYFTDSQNPTLTVAIYVLCFVAISVILLNLLIAIMNERVVEICKHKDSVLKINQLSIYLLMDENRKMDQKLLCSVGLFARFGDMYRFYYTTTNNERIFLHVVKKLDSN